jgi:hypothetical protein
LSGEPSKRKKTTIEVDRELVEFLDQQRRGKGESNNAVLSRLLAGSADVYVGLLLVDNELPITHTVAFQLGEKPDSIYFYDGSKESSNLFYSSVTREFVQQLLKQPAPNMTITIDEARYLQETGLKRPLFAVGLELLKRVDKFLENHPDESDTRGKEKIQTRP